MDAQRPRAARWLWNGFRAAFHPDGARAVVIADRVIVGRLNFDDPTRVDEIALGIEWSPVTLGGLAPQLVLMDADRKLLVVRADGRASLFDLENETATWIRHVETGAVITGITHAVQPTGSSAGLVSREHGALVVDGDRSVALIDAELAQRWNELARFSLLSAAWDPQRGQLVGGTETGEVVVVGRRSGPRIIGRHGAPVTFAHIDHSMLTAITASDDGTVAEWCIRDGSRQFHGTGATVSLISAAKTIDGDVLAASASGGFYRWLRGSTRDPKVLVALGTVAACVSATGVGFTMREEHAIELWDTKKEVLLAVVEQDAENVEDVAFVDDGSRIVARIGDELREWRIEERSPE